MNPCKEINIKMILDKEEEALLNEYTQSLNQYIKETGGPSVTTNSVVCGFVRAALKKTKESRVGNG